MRQGNSPSERVEHERFARAVEPRPGTAPDHPDRDPGGLDAELAIVAALRALAPGLGPDQARRDRMRERITAGRADPPGTATDPAPARVLPFGRRRLAVVLAAALALVFSLSGMGLLLARNALPGDALYGLKRTAEGAALGLTFGEPAKARKYLEHAETRVGELETLAGQYPVAADAPAGAYRTGLDDLDTDATAGSRLLIDLATHGDVRQLESLRTWAARQHARLGTLTPHVPDGMRGRWDGSVDLMARIAGRAAALLGRIDCGQLTTGAADEVGALPATGPCGQAVGSTTLTSPSAGTAAAVSPGTPATRDDGTAGPAQPTATPPVPAATPPVVTPTPSNGTHIPGTQPSVPAPTAPSAVPPPPLPTLVLPTLSPLPALPGIG